MRNEHTRLFIGGLWTKPSDSQTLDVVSPHTEQVIGRVPHADPADVDNAVSAARYAFDHGPWPRMSPQDRAVVLAQLADLYEQHQADFARVITEEMGSPISFSCTNQAPEPLKMLRYYAGLAGSVRWEEHRQGVDGPLTVLREPVGVAALVLPWNVPQWTLMTKLAPALLAGCTVVVKPAPETPLDAYLLAHLVRQTDLPPGVINIVPGGRKTGAHLVQHRGVDKVAFSGSVPTGRAIARECALHLKRCTLELGGKSAAIVLPDADPHEVARGLKTAGFMNSGQACAAQSRVLVPRGLYRDTVDALTAMVESLKVGNPMDPSTDIGPLVSERQRTRVEGFLSAGEAEGARVTTGGLPRPGGRGWYVQPTVFTDVHPDMRIAQEEIFGPVLSVIPYSSPEDAVAIANDSRYGLAGSVWTSDLDRGEFIARRIRTGTFGINGYRVDVAGPFGGYKDSGIGRELGPEGLDAYLEHKTIAYPL